MTWYAARDFCQQRGMSQPTLKDLSQMQTVVKQLRNHGFGKKLKNCFCCKFNFRFVAASVGFWVSASDIGQTPGQFHWPDKSPVDPSLWYKAGGFPQKYKAGQETCVYFYIPTSFGDEPCNSASHILCEIPEVLNSCLWCLGGAKSHFLAII